MRTHLLLILFLSLAQITFAENTTASASLNPSERSVWVWEGWKLVSSPEKSSELLKFCEKPNPNAPKINSLYVCFSNLQLTKPESQQVIASFVKEAHAKQIRVHYLAGSVELAYQVSGGLKCIESLKTYNEAVAPESRLDGIHFDIEPHTMGVVWSQDNRLRDRYMESMKKYYEKFKQNNTGMVFGIDIPTVYGEDPVLLNSLLDSCDYLTIMDYRDNLNSIIAGAEDIMNAAQLKGKKVEIGIEVQRPNKKYGVSPQVTFWDEGSDKMEKVLNEVHDTFKNNKAYAGIAIHHFSAYMELTPGPQVMVDNRKFPTLPTLTALYASTPIKIDGDASKWKSIPTVEVKEPKEVVYGKSTWKSANDLSARAWMAWDENNFYIAIDMTDDKVVQPFEARKMVNGDHIEVWLDLDYEKNKDAGTAGPGVYQIGISPGNFATIPPSILDWVPGDVFKGKENQMDVKSTKTKQGYFVEARIPWSLLGNFKPSDGKPFRINIDPSDTDESDKPIQEALMSTSHFREWGNPKTFRYAEFKK